MATFRLNYWVNLNFNHALKNINFHEWQLLFDCKVIIRLQKINAWLNSLLLLYNEFPL